MKQNNRKHMEIAIKNGILRNNVPDFEEIQVSVNLVKSSLCERWLFDNPHLISNLFKRIKNNDIK